MYLIKGNAPDRAIKTGIFPLTSSHSTADLPPLYLKLLEQQNGGYTQNIQIQTKEPTSDGLDYAHIHYILGIHDDPPHSILFQQDIITRETLPDYFIIFSTNDQQLFAFDYSQLSDEGEPAIRYIDLETGNWQTVSPTFKLFLERLEPGEIQLPLQEKLTLSEAEHAFLLTTDPAMLSGLWMHLEDCVDKSWYFSWLKYFSKHHDVGIRQATVDALETQILYFRLYLPEHIQDVFDILLEDPEDSIRHQAEWLIKEWKEIT